MRLKQLVTIFISWRLILLLVAFLAIQLIPFKPSFPHSQAILEPLGPKLLHRWANFDGVHYLTIVEKGYFSPFSGSIQAFFPLYPLVTRYLNKIINQPLISGLIISHLSLFLGLWFFIKLVRLDETKTTTTNALILLLAFPTAFFFGCFYTESLFFFLLVFSFYCARKKHWLLAGLSGALAAATRLVGVFLVPALILEWYQQTKPKKRLKSIPQFLAAFLPLAGLLSFMRYLFKTFADAFLFLHVQPAFGASRETDRLILLYQVFWRYLRMIISVPKNNLLFYTVTSEFLFGLVFLVLVILAFYHTRRSYALFATLAYLAPTLTGTFSSMPRYTLMLFPAFIVLAKVIKSRPIFYLLVFFSGILQVINLALFIQGYWVA